MGKLRNLFRLRKDTAAIEQAFVAYVSDLVQQMFGEPYVPRAYSLQRIGETSTGAVLWYGCDETYYLGVYLIDDSAEGDSPAEVVVAMSEEREELYFADEQDATAAIELVERCEFNPELWAPALMEYLQRGEPRCPECGGYIAHGSSKEACNNCGASGGQPRDAEKDGGPERHCPSCNGYMSKGGTCPQCGYSEAAKSDHDYRVLKADAEQRYTLGVAYPADEVDCHGDFADATELEKAAWHFMTSGQVVKAGAGLDHAEGTDLSGTVVESYIYRGPDWTNETGDRVAKSGDWMLGAIWSEDAWASIKAGERTGWSIQGVALIDDDAEAPA